MEADVADELGVAAQFDGVETEAFGGEMGFDAVDHGVAFFSSQMLREKFHHARIGVQFRERLTIARLPISKAKAVGFEHDDKLSPTGRDGRGLAKRDGHGGKARRARRCRAPTMRLRSLLGVLRAGFFPFQM